MNKYIILSLTCSIQVAYLILLFIIDDRKLNIACHSQDYEMMGEFIQLSIKLSSIQFSYINIR